MWKHRRAFNSCTSPNPISRSRTAPPESQAYVQNFNKQAQHFGANPNLQNIVFSIVPASLISQMATKLVGNNFYINSSNWAVLSNNCEKEKFLFRELARWTLGRDYIAQQSSNVNSSLMSLGGFSCDIYVVNYNYFMRELFTQTYVSFNSNPSYNQKVNGWTDFNNMYR
jgi:hypothetical protein